MRNVACEEMSYNEMCCHVGRTAEHESVKCSILCHSHQEKTRGSYLELERWVQWSSACLGEGERGDLGG